MAGRVFKSRVDWSTAFPKLLEMARTGTPSLEMAKHLGVTRSTVNKMLRDRGYDFTEVRKKNRKKIKYDWSEYDPIILKMAKEGKCRRDIAKALNVPLTTITERCHRHGIKLVHAPRGRYSMENNSAIPVSKSKHLTFREIRRIDKLVLKGWNAVYAIEEIRSNTPEPLFRE